MTTLLLAEHGNHHLSEQTARALSAAQKIGGEVHVFVIGSGITAIAEEAAQLLGVSKVLVADDGSLANQLAEPLAELIVSRASEYNTIMAPATAIGKSVMPRVAALLDVAQVSEIIDVVSYDTFKRPIYAGNAIQTVQTSDAKRVITVRASAFAPAQTGGTATIEVLPVAPTPTLSQFVGASLSSSTGRPDLAAAKIVISGGRALGSADKFREVILPVADKLGAAVGASRAAVDSGYAPNDWQVGQTGKVVAPDLYIACGISGAIQHLAGMKDSKIIVAINKDPDAPIFQVADYGLVADLFDILPEFKDAL